MGNLWLHFHGIFHLQERLLLPCDKVNAGAIHDSPEIAIGGLLNALQASNEHKVY
jgi:hypothetical protein